MAEEKALLKEDAVSVMGVADSKAEELKPEIRVGVKEDIEDMRRRLKAIVSRVVVFGLNTPANSVVAEIARRTGLVDEKWVQLTSIEVQNNLQREFFKRVPRDERIVFIPHCLRDAKNCVAPIDEDGYHCQKCGRCVIGKITAECEKRGMKWYMCGSGSQVQNLILKHRPKAIVGIACFNEIQMALEKLKTNNVPTQAVLLRKSGCVNTEVVLDDIVEVLDL